MAVAYEYAPTKSGPSLALLMWEAVYSRPKCRSHLRTFLPIAEHGLPVQCPRQSLARSHASGRTRGDEVRACLWEKPNWTKTEHRARQISRGNADQTRFEGLWIQATPGIGAGFTAGAGSALIRLRHLPPPCRGREKWSWPWHLPSLCRGRERWSWPWHLPSLCRDRESRLRPSHALLRKESQDICIKPRCGVRVVSTPFERREFETFQARVAGAGADDLAVNALLDDVRAQAGGAGDHEQRGEHGGGHAITW